MPLDFKQEQFLYGGLLGDSSISKQIANKRNCHLAINHSLDQCEYANFKYSLMKEYVRTTPKISKNGGWGGELIRFNTLSYPCFTRAREICYRNGRKTLNIKWLSKIADAFALSIWYMDDGSLSPNGSMTIHTQSFSFEENQMLQDWLAERWNIRPQLIQDKRIAAHYLIFRAQERDKFFALIKPHIIPSMAYKVTSEVITEVPTATCPICKGTFLPKRNVYATAISRSWNLYCSSKCAKYAHLRRYYSPQPMPCVVCGRVFTPHTGNQKTCSSVCRGAYNHLKKNENARAYRLKAKLGMTYVPSERLCKGCGRCFNAQRWNQVTCCHDCSLIHSQSRNREQSKVSYARAKARLDSVKGRALVRLALPLIA